MSFWLNNSLVNSEEINEQRLMIADFQFTAGSKAYENAFKSCLKQCIPHHYTEGELNKGETVCADRCVVKFMKANLLIGQYIQQTKFANPQNMGAYQNLPLNNNNK
ncbi:Tim12 protein [Saccharomycopsis crataegensis]|uniref:Mitochondrial import inner membrane translocase subunit n=1 Tax=Saccharomycopsis crataegensis TaxID=43959 RepID=A0AAV5QFV0_9ASCO|nr:Tim12 protein [Saccharomycopsis crataegensis]